MKLKSSGSSEINLVVPKIAFQGDANARLVAILKSDFYSLPKREAYVKGKIVGVLSLFE